MHRVQKKGDELSPQEYDKYITVQHKKKKTVLLENKSPLTCIMKSKATPPNITSPDKMEVCGIIDEFPDDTSPVMMEDCVNKHLDDITRKYLNEINEIGVDEEGVEKYLMENEDVIYRDATKNEPETNWCILKEVIE